MIIKNIKKFPNFTINKNYSCRGPTGELYYWVINDLNQINWYVSKKYFIDIKEHRKNILK